MIFVILLWQQNRVNKVKLVPTTKREVVHMKTNLHEYIIKIKIVQ